MNYREKEKEILDTVLESERSVGINYICNTNMFLPEGSLHIKCKLTVICSKMCPDILTIDNFPKNLMYHLPEANLA